MQSLHGNISLFVCNLCNGTLLTPSAIHAQGYCLSHLQSMHGNILLLPLTTHVWESRSPLLPSVHGNISVSLCNPRTGILLTKQNPQHDQLMGFFSPGDEQKAAHRGTGTQRGAATGRDPAGGPTQSANWGFAILPRKRALAARCSTRARFAPTSHSLHSASLHAQQIPHFSFLPSRSDSAAGKGSGSVPAAAAR